MTKPGRRRLLQLVGSGVLAGVVPGVGSAKKDTYPKVSDLGMYEDHPVEVFAAGAQPHPNQNRIAVVTASFGDGIQLYIADGAETVNDVPESIYRITDDANGGVFEPRWKEGNRIEYVKDFVRYKLKIPPSYKKLDHKTVTENVLEENGGDST